MRTCGSRIFDPFDLSNAYKAVENLFSSDKNSGPLLLEPDKDNYHEIWNAGDKPAVFLDILAPPYTNQEESEDTT